MVSSHTEDFLYDVFQEAIRVRAFLCLLGHQIDSDETHTNDGQTTAANLVWNHFVALHNSNRAFRHCALDLSEDNESDALIASALTHAARLLDFIEDKTSLPPITATGAGELLETAVRTQAALEMLVGSWKTIRQIFRQKGDEQKSRATNQAARSAGIAAADWRVVYESLLLEHASESSCEGQGPTRYLNPKEITGLEPPQKAILDDWSNQEQEPCKYTLMSNAGTGSFLLGCHMVRVWLEKAKENRAYIFVPPYCFKDEVDKTVRSVAQMSKEDPRLVVEHLDSVQASNTEGMVWLAQVDYAQMLARPYLDFYRDHPPKRLLVSHEPTGQWIDPPAGMMELLRHSSPAPLHWDVIPAAGEGRQRFKDLRHNEWYDNFVTLFNQHSPVSDHYLVCMYLSILASEAMSHQDLPEDFWTTGKVRQYLRTIRRRQAQGMDVEHLLDDLRENPASFRGSFSHIMFELVRNGILRVPDYADMPDLPEQAQRFKDAVLPIATKLLEEEGLLDP